MGIADGQTASVRYLRIAKGLADEAEASATMRDLAEYCALDTYAMVRLLDEMLRIGRECIITFPNFGNWRCRLQIAGKGRMPVSRFMPYTWYDTPNIHFCTVLDFEALCREQRVEAEPAVAARARVRRLARGVACDEQVYHAAAEGVLGPRQDGEAQPCMGDGVGEAPEEGPGQGGVGGRAGG